MKLNLSVIQLKLLFGVVIVCALFLIVIMISLDAGKITSEENGGFEIVLTGLVALGAAWAGWAFGREQSKQDEQEEPKDKH